MEMSFSELRTKEVVNTQDGKKLGRICDLLFCYPENKIFGFVVPGGKSGFFKREERFVAMKNIVRIGEDVILVNLPANDKGELPCNPCPSESKKPNNPCCDPRDPRDPHASHNRRSFEEYE